MTTDKTIRITKPGIFYTIQGEGLLSGSPSIFFRTAFCNLRCKWQSGNICDTPHSSYKPEFEQITIDNLVARGKVLRNLYHNEPTKAVITGGEPLMQYEAVYAAIQQLKQQNVCDHFTIETNGTYPFGQLVFRDDILLSISPKLDSASASLESQQALKKNLKEIKNITGARAIQIKFVIGQESDVREAMEFVEEINIPKHLVFFMPEGVYSNEVRKTSIWLADVCKGLNVNFTDRLHLHLWERALDK